MSSHANDKKYLGKVLLIFVGAFVLYRVICHVIPRFPDTIQDEFAGQMVLLLIAAAAALPVKKLGVLKFKGKGFGTGIKAGLFVLAVAVLKLLQWGCALVLGTTDISVPGIDIVIFVIYVLIIGISEELLFRGILLEGLLDYFGNGSGKALRTAAVIAGCIFGAVHVINYIGDSDCLYAIVAVLNVMADGFLFCAIYIRSGRNIWPCVLLHSLKDAALYLSGGYLCAATTDMAEAAPAEASLGLDFAVFVVAFCTAVIALDLMKDKKLAPFIEVSKENA